MEESRRHKCYDQNKIKKSVWIVFSLINNALLRETMVKHKVLPWNIEIYTRYLGGWMVYWFSAEHHHFLSNACHTSFWSNTWCATLQLSKTLIHNSSQLTTILLKHKHNQNHSIFHQFHDYWFYKYSKLTYNNN